jgi:alpha-amylase
VVLDAPVTPDAAAAAQPIDWHGRSIYFVVTDRFANGDPTNDNADGFASNAGDPNAWHGGDLRGVIDRLDYIAGMGFTGLWITPVIAQHDVHAYHGYWGWDWSRIDGHLGDLATLRELVAKAHARGIAVMIDTVANHTGRYDYQAPSFPEAAMYHHNGNITDYNDPTQVENNDLNGLNDLAQENPVVHDKLLDHVRWLVRESGADGLRVDTVKHVPKAFWSDWVVAANTFTIGEVLDGSVDANAAYAHILSATLDYPMYFAIASALGKGGSARQLGGVLAQDGKYRDASLQGVFVDNHDQPRFLCGAGDAELRLALAFALTVRGIPIIYYGTEQGLRSCATNREDLTVVDPSAPLARFITQLNAIRAATPALRTGTQHERWQDDTAYAFEREAGASTAVVGVNTSGTDRTLPLQHLHVPDGTVLHDRFGSATITVSGGTLALVVPAHGAVILTN